jgi:hypothetical protein
VSRVFCDHQHAVERDLLEHRFRFTDLGLDGDVELPFWKFCSFVLGAAPTSALGHAVAEGWSKTDHLLANLTEQHANLIQLEHRYPRPGLPKESEPEKPAASAPATAKTAQAAIRAGGRFTVFDSPADFHKKLAEHRARTQKLPNSALAESCPKTA